MRIAMKLLFLILPTYLLGQSIMPPILSVSAYSSAANPTLSTGTGTYIGPQIITITDAGYVICYTTNGSNILVTTQGVCPAGSSTYSGPISITQTGTVLNTVATAVNFNQSATVSATYTINATAPSFSPNSSFVPPGTVVTVSSESSCNSKIYWSTVNPPTTSDTNSTSITVSSAGTYYAKVIGCTTEGDSAVGSITYAMGPVTTCPAILTNSNTTVIEFCTNTAITSWTVPTSVTSIKVEAIGAGAGGGTGGGGAGGAAGGGGAYATLAGITVTPGASIPIQIGVGGAAKTSGASAGNNGTDTKFNTTIVIAKAGNGGCYGNGGTCTGAGGLASASTPTAGAHSGGNGGTNGFSGGAGGGGAAGPNTDGLKGANAQGSGGGGGGGADGGTAGTQTATTSGGAGGNGRTGAGGGAGDTGSGAGDGTLGGGGGGSRSGCGAARAGDGGITANWDSTHGAGGGGGGGGGGSCTARAGNGLFGGGGGSTAPATSNSSGKGGDGILVITYTNPY